MKAVLLAAGKGTRLRPLTEACPKVMIPIDGKPLLERHVEQLAAAGVRDVFINLHHLPESIRDYFGSGEHWGIRIGYSFEPDILGTAGAVRKLAPELAREPFLVVYGDNYLEVPYGDFIGRAEANTGLGTIAVFEKDDISGSGVLTLAADGRIVGFHEKPRPEDVPSRWVNAGVYYFRPRVLEHIGPGYSDFGYDVLPRVIASGEEIYAFKLGGQAWGLDSPELLAVLRKFLKGNP